MRIKKYTLVIVFLLLLLPLINSYLNNDFLSKHDDTSKNKENDQSDSDKLKLSFIQDWNKSYDNGDNEYGRGIAVNELNGDIYVTGFPCEI